MYKIIPQREIAEKKNHRILDFIMTTQMMELLYINESKQYDYYYKAEREEDPFEVEKQVQKVYDGKCGVFFHHDLRQLLMDLCLKEEDVDCYMMKCSKFGNSSHNSWILSSFKIATDKRQSYKVLTENVCLEDCPSLDVSAIVEQVTLGRGLRTEQRFQGSTKFIFAKVFIINKKS